MKDHNPVALTAHDIHADNGQQPWNQVYVREGSKGSGYWSLEIMEDGDYEVALRRYPVEADLLINTTTPALTKKQFPGLENEIPAGVNLNYTKASVKIGSVKNEVKVANKDKEAKMKLTLKAGKTTMNASFFNKEGEENVAYYVYITKL